MLEAHDIGTQANFSDDPIACDLHAAEPPGLGCLFSQAPEARQNGQCTGEAWTIVLKGKLTLFRFLKQLPMLATTKVGTTKVTSLTLDASKCSKDGSFSMLCGTASCDVYNVKYDVKVRIWEVVQ